MSLKRVLQDQGLAENEAQVFLAVLRLGESNVSQIAKRARVKRPTAYVLLERLQQQGLVGQIKKERTLYYRGINPYALIDDRYNKFRQLKESLPELLRLHEMHTATPETTVYEGAQGIKRIMEDTLNSSTEILAWANMELAAGVLQEYYPNYVKRRVENGIRIKAIFTFGPVGLEYKKRDHLELRESYLIPGTDFPLKNEINIYDHKVAIMSHKDLVGVVIQNQAIADTQRSIYRMNFEQAKFLEKGLLEQARKR